MSFCSPQTKTVEPQRYDPLYPDSGAPKQRDYVFGAMTAARPAMERAANEAAGAAFSASKDPGFRMATDLAHRRLRGDYLNGSPQLQGMVDRSKATIMRSAGDQDARIRSMYARTGSPMSTAQTQALAGSRALAAASAADSEAGLRYQDFQVEKGRQDEAINLLNAGLSQPINYLSGVGNAYLQPLSQYSQILAALAGNGQIMTPDTAILPSKAQQIGSGVSSLANAAGGVAALGAGGF